jgi:hypothetical protein
MKCFAGHESRILRSRPDITFGIVYALDIDLQQHAWPASFLLFVESAKQDRKPITASEALAIDLELNSSRFTPLETMRKRFESYMNDARSISDGLKGSPRQTVEALLSSPSSLIIDIDSASKYLDKMSNLKNPCLDKDYAERLENYVAGRCSETLESRKSIRARLLGIKMPLV